jgi:dTMP kinase
MKFVVIEGLDGSGKSTQIKLLRKYMEDEGVDYRYLHFPRTEAPVYGDLIARFLRGELGNIQTVDPYIIALLYAGDRNDAKELIREWQKQNLLVLVDRYVISNIAFQCAKYQLPEARAKLHDWINYFEYGYNNLPVPDLNIFLDVPFTFTQEMLSKSRQGDDRDYLNGQDDIHENNLDFQKSVREVYLSLDGKERGYIIMNCADSFGEILAPEVISKEIINLIF